MEILAVKNLSFSYPDAASPALENISFSVSEGEFIVLCGESGCGKTTLLRLLKRELAPAGKISGEISLFDKPQSELDERASASEIGYVMQNPETQIVTDKVWHELAFGMEGLGFESEKIRLRAGEMAGYFGIDSWFRADTASLSGGQKQLLSLASVMALSPRLLLLDEPTAQLDPVAASDFISDIYRLNRDLGVTVIIAEHRLEELLPIADRAAVMEDGRIVSFDSPRAVCNALGSRPISAGFPAASRISAALADSGKSPLTVREGRRFLSSLDIRRGASVPADKPSDGESENAVEMKNVWFRYERNTPDILRGLNLSLKRGEIFSLLGGNGAGKTTVLKVLSGIEKPYRGKIKLLGKNIKDYRGNELHFHNVALLPQNVRDVFLRDTVESDLRDMCRVLGYSAVQADEKISAVSEKLGISRLFGKHPYDLSGGEAQKCALAKVLLSGPKILLLDEPTKGIDAHAKLILRDILFSLKREGVTVIAVNHDTEFAAIASDKCALFFDGEVISPSSPRNFFSGNDFYTTAASRISRGIFENTVTVDDVVLLAKGEAHS